MAVLLYYGQSVRNEITSFYNVRSINSEAMHHLCGQAMSHLLALLTGFDQKIFLRANKMDYFLVSSLYEKTTYLFFYKLYTEHCLIETFNFT